MYFDFVVSCAFLYVQATLCLQITFVTVKRVGDSKFMLESTYFNTKILE